MKRIVWLLPGLLLGAQVGAEIYKWVDEQGRVHYTDRPQQTDSQPVELPTQTHGLEAGAGHQQQQQKLLNIYREERLKKAADAAKAREEKAVREENCRRATRRYEMHSHVGGIYQKNAQGERQYLDEASRAAYLDRLRREMQQWCGKSAATRR